MKKSIIEQKLEYLHDSRKEECMKLELDEAPGTQKLEWINDQLSFYETELFKIKTDEYFKKIEKENQ